MQVKKQQLEPDMGQRTGSILGKEYIKANQYMTFVAFSSLLPCGPRMAVVPLTPDPRADEKWGQGTAS